MISRKIPVTHLLDFLAVVRCGSINRAAEELHISQPALTRSIRHLEERLVVPLLERTTSGVTPTDFGKAILPHLQAVESQLQEALFEIDSLRGTTTGKVRFGGTPLLIEKIVPPALEKFSREWPNLSIEFVEGLQDPLMEGLKKNYLDFILSPALPEDDEPDLLQEALLTDAVIIVAHPENPIARRRNLTLRDLVQCKWVLPVRPSALRPKLEHFFRTEGLDLPAFAIETSILRVTKQLVMKTDRIAALPSMMVEAEVRRKELVALKGEWSFIHRPFSIFFRNGTSLSPVARALIRTIKETARDSGLWPKPR